jgi:tetratricopeptide (TPR) repeat protein
MNNLIIYSIEVAISLALFYSAFWLLLKKETFFKLNRFYLLSTVVISLLLPALNVRVVANSSNSSFIMQFLILPTEKFERTILGSSEQSSHSATIRHPERFEENHVVGSADPNTTNNSQVVPSESLSSLSSAPLAGSENFLLKILFVIYCIGAGILLLRFFANFLWISNCISKHKAENLAGVKVIRFKNNSSAFSFLNFVFINSRQYPEEELTRIISHEKVHISQKHSWDMIFFELLLVFQWFNPIAWFYKREIKITHEYLADEGTLKSGIDLPDYQYSLLNQLLQENNFEMASTYNFSVKERIAMMMKKRSSGISALKAVIIFPILFVLFISFGFDPQIVGKNAETDNSKSNFLADSSVKKVKASVEYLRQLEGEYLSTNDPRRSRTIIFTEVLGSLFGYDGGYTYKLVYDGDGKFINPDDKASLVFNATDKNAVSLLLFGKINLNKVNFAKGSSKVQQRSMAFTLLNVMLKNGIPSALSYYNKAKDSSHYFLTEFELNWAGYEMLQAGKPKESAALFKLNTELFPESYNVYDSYGEALLAAGDKSGAIQNYRKSVLLNPGSKSGIENLKALGVNPDTVIRTVNVSMEYLKLLEGNYLSTNQPNGVRWIRFEQENGELKGNDNGYKYRLIPVADGKFINPDDGASLVFDTRDRSALSLLLF